MFKIIYPNHQVLSSSGCTKNVSQMPVVLLPLHVDRSPLKPVPSSARAIALRYILFKHQWAPTL